MDVIFLKIVYKTSGTCSDAIEIEVEEGILKDVNYLEGCHGNTQGISRLVKGMKVSEVIERLEGIRCEDRQTSCPDQLARALRTTLQ